MDDSTSELSENREGQGLAFEGIDDEIKTLLSAAAEKFKEKDGKHTNQGPGFKKKEDKRRENKKIKKEKGMAKGKNEESYTMFSKGYKTVPCEFYLKGNCHKGEDCKFRHDVEQKPLDVLCKFYLAGSCNKDSCLYLHDKSQYPCKFLHISGKCEKMTECPFSHARFSSKAQIEDFIKQNLENLRIHRDKGVGSTILSYAIECGLVKHSAQAERDQSTLIPPGLYDNQSVRSFDDFDQDQKLEKGGQIDESKLQQIQSQSIAQESNPSTVSKGILFMP